MGQAAAAVRGCSDRQEDTGSQTPGWTQAGGAEPRYTPCIRVWGRLGGRNLGGPRHPGRWLGVETDRQTPPSLPPALSRRSPYRHTPPASPAPDTRTHRSSPGRWQTHARPLGARRTHPGRHPRAGHRWLGRLQAGGGRWRRPGLGAGAGGTRTLALFSYTHTHAHTHTHSLGMRLTFSPRPPLPGDPQPPFLGSLGTPPPVMAGGGGRPLPQLPASAFLLGPESEGLQINLGTGEGAGGGGAVGDSGPAPELQGPGAACPPPPPHAEVCEAGGHPQT